jgi:hypothetical protein
MKEKEYKDRNRGRFVDVQIEEKEGKQNKIKE